MPKQNNHRPPMKKGVLRRLLGMLFRFYPVLLPIAIVCIVFAAIALTGGAALAGWRLVLCALFFTGGLNLAALGVAGEYIGKIYLETKHRPAFLIDRFLHSDADDRPTELP